METSEILKKVRRIEIKTRGLSQNIFAGEYHSSFKGRGMTFSEVREYGIGDDVRNIDWNVTARFGKPYIKVFEEERELTVMLLIDVSGSRNFGTQSQMKRDMITEIAATLAFSTIQNNDKVGVILFSSKIELFIPPKKGRTHVLHIIRQLIDFHPEENGTDIGMALEYFTNAIKRRCTAFLISDFISNKDYLKSMQLASRRHALYALQIYDLRDAELPNIGLLKIRDAETNQRYWIDTSDDVTRKIYHNHWDEQQLKLNQTLLQSNVDSVSIRTDEDYVKSLLRLFKHRV